MLLGKFNVKKFVKTVRKERRIKRQYEADQYKHKEAMNMAIDYCIDHNILAEFLRKYRSEVLDMLLEEFELIKFEKTVREEGRDEGAELMSRLTKILLEQNRTEDLQRAAVDPEYRKQLLKEFGL